MPTASWPSVRLWRSPIAPLTVCVSDVQTMAVVVLIRASFGPGSGGTGFSITLVDPTFSITKTFIVSAMESFLLFAGMGEMSVIARTSHSASSAVFCPSEFSASSATSAVIYVDMRLFARYFTAEGAENSPPNAESAEEFLLLKSRGIAPRRHDHGLMFLRQRAPVEIAVDLPPS